MKKVELLAPAGSYETMVGAFNAGADAVYLGGLKYGARAYAENFDTEQVLDAVSYAHLHGKKIYMTVNTLIKEREYHELYDFMLPFAEKRLDGVIVQDLGVMKLIKDEFPSIEIHGSTQQTITGVHGARLLKELGCVRVVPARELSLTEMQRIREEAGIEVEAFIHGAMCYCYSGMCLFSSMIGQRSGNRGRCAQPCRLPYFQTKRHGDEEQYPLSLKDMCTVDIIPKLIEAGIDSFKIEGRMKKPEYAAGVTHIYRKYIDLYYDEPDKAHEVEKEDMDMLKALYLRTGVSRGYYFEHNGRDMITLDSPAYNGSSEEKLSQIREKYISKKLKLKCQMLCRLKAGEAAYLKLTVKTADGRVTSKEIRGGIVSEAKKRPMDAADIQKQLLKLGKTPFEAEKQDIMVEIDDGGSGIFIPIGELNELRRTLCESMVKELLPDVEIISKGTKSADTENKKALKSSEPDIHVLVNSKNQLDAALRNIDEESRIKRLYVSSALIMSSEIGENLKNCRAELIAALPYMTRSEEYDAAKEIKEFVKGLTIQGFDGVLARNLEQLGLLHEMNYSGKIIADYGIYVWNAKAAEVLSELCDEISIPLELTIHEAKEVADRAFNESELSVSLNVYGFAPMMVSAGCVKKTLSECSGQRNGLHFEETAIYDRKGNELKVTADCLNCYNVIWNAHPTSLHGKLDEILSMKSFDHLRIDFTTETGDDADKVLRHFTAVLNGNPHEDIFKDLRYTTGHYKRGAE